MCEKYNRQTNKWISQTQIDNKTHKPFFRLELNQNSEIFKNLKNILTTKEFIHRGKGRRDNWRSLDSVGFKKTILSSILMELKM